MTHGQDDASSSKRRRGNSEVDSTSAKQILNDLLEKQDEWIKETIEEASEQFLKLLEQLQRSSSSRTELEDKEFIPFEVRNLKVSFDTTPALRETAAHKQSLKVVEEAVIKFQNAVKEVLKDVRDREIIDAQTRATSTMLKFCLQVIDDGLYFHLQSMTEKDRASLKIPTDKMKLLLYKKWKQDSLDDLGTLLLLAKEEVEGFFAQADGEDDPDVEKDTDAEDSGLEANPTEPSIDYDRIHSLRDETADGKLFAIVYKLLDGTFSEATIKHAMRRACEKRRQAAAATIIARNKAAKLVNTTRPIKLEAKMHS
jgi:hypothetical protein